MKLTHKYLNPIIVFFAVYMFGYLLYNAGISLTRAVYTYMNHIFPESFPLYEKLAEKEALAGLYRIFELCGMLIALFLINLIALRLENKKYERIVILTDGQYLIKDGVRLYFKEFFASDVITSVLTPVLLVIPPYFISEGAMSYLIVQLPCWMGYTLSLDYSLAVAVVTVAVFSFLGRMLSVPLCIRAWRAAWLSEI